jgi:hypothetical protein
MNDYLSIPSFYSNLQKNICSPNLQDAIEKEDLLNYLRQVYQSNIALFYNIRDEFILRGIVFKEEYQNNIFPALHYEIKHIIITDNLGQKYLDIDNIVTGIQALINRYNVKSDYFFVNVPLEGLAYSLNIEASFLAKQLERVGFAIIPIEEYIAKDLCFGELEEKVLKEDEDLQEFSPLQDDIRIKECFDGREFLAFTLYCEDNGKKFFSQLTLDFVNRFQHVKGVGRKKYLKVVERLNELKEERDIPDEQSLESKKIIKITPMEYFVNNPLRRVLERKNEDYLRFLDSVYVSEEDEMYSIVQSDVFKERSNFVKILVDEINEEEKEKQFLELTEKIKNHVNYPYVMEMTKGNICCLVKITLQEGENNIHLFEMLEDKKYIDELLLIYSGLNRLKPVNVKIVEIMNSLDERDWKIVIHRLNKTLQEVGELIGVTRERVRQIELKALRKLQLIIKPLQLEIYFNHFLQHDISMSLEAFMEKLQIDPYFKEVFTICISQNKHLEFKNGVLINKDLYDYVLGTQDVIKGWNKTLVDASEVLAQFASGGEFDFTVHTIDMCMEEIGFKRRNSLYFKRNIKLPDQIAYLFKNKIKVPLEMTDERFDYLQVLMDEVFGEHFESGKRAAVARIRDTNNVILVEANTFMYYDLDAVQQELIDDIEKAIEEALVMDELVSANTLFQRHKNTWESYNINTHYQLYSILQYHLSDVYVIGKGNTLGIYRSNEAKVDIESVLIAHLEKVGGTCSKEDILDYFKWPSYKLEQLIARSREFISVEEEGLVGIGVKLFSSFEFTENELEKLRRFINDYMVDTYLFPIDLFTEMEFNDELSEILAKRNITNLYTFVSLLKWLNPDLRGFPQLLYLKDSEVNSIEGAISNTFNAIVRRDELEDFLVEKGYALSSITSVITSLLENNSFYNYTAYQFINGQQIDFNDKVRESLKTYLQKSFDNKSYLSALDLTGYTTDVLPVSKYEWRPQLITAFVHEVGYRYIRTTSDYRYNKWILIRDDLNVTNYEELVQYVITHEYEGNFHERDIAQFLAGRKLAHSPYQLPIEIKTSKYFVTKDLGFIEVRERRNGINRITVTV